MKAAILLAPLLLAGCIHLHPDETPAPFILLNAGVPTLMDLAASATQLTSDVAVTARHARWIAPGATWVMAGPMDIAYFRSTQARPLRAVDPVRGEAVTAWGTSPWSGTARHESARVIEPLVSMRQTFDRPVLGFVIDAELSSGYSGGPVINARGELVGIITNTITLDDGRTGTFAYWAVDVLKALQHEEE